MGDFGRNHVETKAKRSLANGWGQNTNFHKMANACRRRNFLVKFRVNAKWLVEEVKIKEEVFNAFQTLWLKLRET